MQIIIRSLLLCFVLNNLLIELSFFLLLSIIIIISFIMLLLFYGKLRPSWCTGTVCDCTREGRVFNPIRVIELFHIFISFSW